MYKINFISLFLLVFLCICGCNRHNSSPTQSENTNSASPAINQNPIDPNHDNIPSQPDIGSHLLFSPSVPWPPFDPSHPDAPIYHIESGSDSNGAWFEGKGFFKGQIKDIIPDLTDPLIMGPSNVTKALERKNYSENDTSIKYDMNVKMDYIFTVEFDLTVVIDNQKDNQGEINQIHYESHKTNGIQMIKQIDEIIVISRLSNNWYSVEFQSMYNAVIVKEKETKDHFEQLFARWKEK